MSFLAYGNGKSLSLVKNPATGKMFIAEPPFEEIDKLTDEEYQSLVDVYTNFHRKHYPGQAMRVPPRMSPSERERFLAYLDDEAQETE
jgi:hypothetical protein